MGVFEELPIVATETTVVKRMARDALARTVQKTAAKKKAARKSAKKPKAKKAKKAKKVRFPGGKRPKVHHKSKAAVAAGKRNAAKMKAAGKGLFKKCTFSADLAAVTGLKGGTRAQATKAVWNFIKKNNLNKG